VKYRVTSSNRSSLTKPKFTRAPPRWVSLPKEDEISWLQSIAQLPLRATCAGLLVLVIPSRPASSEVPDGTWLFANRVAVEVFECSGLVRGRIVWLLRPRTPAGQPDVDRLNPDSTLRQRPLCGLTIIWGLQPDGAGHWSNGWLYDPQDGNTYGLTAERTAPNEIFARVYRGVPLFGRTEILIRDPQLSFDGRC
jgi:hypothetical protein